MEIVVFGFMVLVAVMCIFTVAVVLRDMIVDRSKRKTAKSVEEQEQNQQSAVVVTPESDDQVRFCAEPKQNHKNKYMALDSVQKAWYDEIADYANSVEEVKCVTAGGYDEYRLHGKRIVRLLIKRGTVICEFVIANPNFSRYVSTNKITVKQAATSLKLTTARDVGAAKDSIDIAVREIREEREEAKLRQKQRRRLARQASRTEAQVAVQTVATTSTD